jgi:hypothetical protein
MALIGAAFAHYLHEQQSVATLDRAKIIID